MNTAPSRPLEDEAAPARDRSVPRRRLREGERTRDGRGRLRSARPLLHYGFRPFFLLAGIHAAAAIPLWLWFFANGAALPGPFPPLSWHVHEMLFGYLGAVIAGFILTAIPNWTGRLPLSGTPLAVLALLWLAGRLATASVSVPLAATFIDLSFPVVLAGAVWREILAGRNWRNAPVALMLTLFALANGLHHGEAAGLLQEGLAIRLALSVAAMLMALIGGRIVPSFTRNWLVKRGARALPAAFGLLDKAALGTTAIALVGWIMLPETTFTGTALLLAGILLFARLSRWQGWQTGREAILLILHIGYAWLAGALLLIGAGILAPGTIPASAAIHALTAGAIATMTLAVMTRASLGHTGRDIRADGWTAAIYLMANAGALLRVIAPFAAQGYLPLLAAAGTLWSGAFLLFVLRYWRVLTGPRL